MKKIVAANWKMNKTISEGVSFVLSMKKQKTKHDIVLFPPFICLEQAAKNTNCQIGAQNCHEEDSGAFTGEVSAKMIRSVGCNWVLLGHSERRKYQKETNQQINKKVKIALKNSLKVMLCVGENEEERKQHLTQEKIERQLIDGLKDLPSKERENVAIAYEPIWAIGTGKTATPFQAEEVHKFIRKTIEINFGKDISKSIKILYGGSVTEENASSLFKMKNIDGVLVGGASLDLEKFLKIANS